MLHVTLDGTPRRSTSACRLAGFRVSWVEQMTLRH